MQVMNNNRTLFFNVNKTEYAGQQYFFKLILKEEGFNAIGFPYYFQVEVESLDANNTGGGGTGNSTGGN